VVGTVAAVITEGGKEEGAGLECFCGPCHSLDLFIFILLLNKGF